MELTEHMNDALSTLLASLPMDGPGLAVGVALGGRTVYRRGVGLANLEQAMPVTPATRMRIGSVTKQMTCLAALLMADDGQLDLDAGVRHYLPEFAPPPDESGEPTLRQLMWHVGGQRCYLDAGILSDGLAVKPPGAALCAQVRQREANAAIGESLIYSNGGYHLLSLAMARAAGSSIATILEARLFAPLGMRATILVPSDLAPASGMATHYTGSAAQGYLRGIFPTEELLGEGGVVSSVDDMLLWIGELRLQRLGSAQVWRQMCACPELSNGFRSQYAGGLFIEPYRGLRTMNHAGNVVGGASHLLFLPDAELGIVVLTNGAPVDPIALAERIVDIMLDLGSTPARNMANTTDYAGYLGTYACYESGMVCALCDEEGQLGLSVYQSPAETLECTADGLELSFSRNSAGHFRIAATPTAASVREFVLDDCGRPHRMVRLELRPTGADRLDGRYDCADLDATAYVADSRVMRIEGRFGHNRLVIEPLSDGMYTLRSEDPGLPRGGVLRVRHEHGIVQALQIDMARTRHVVFERRAEAA